MLENLSHRRGIVEVRASDTLARPWENYQHFKHYAVYQT